MWGWSRIEDNFSEIQYKKEDDLSEDDIHHFNLNPLIPMVMNKKMALESWF